MGRMSKEDRYCSDPLFKTIVDQMYRLICEGEFTPTEIREAALLAQIKYEMNNPKIKIDYGVNASVKTGKIHCAKCGKELTKE